MFVPLTFDPSFRPFLNDLAQFQSTKDLEGSGLYRKLKPDIERIRPMCGTRNLFRGFPPARIRRGPFGLLRGTLNVECASIPSSSAFATVKTSAVPMC